MGRIEASENSLVAGALSGLVIVDGRKVPKNFREMAY